VLAVRRRPVRRLHQGAAQLADAPGRHLVMERAVCTCVGCLDAAHRLLQHNGRRGGKAAADAGHVLVGALQHEVQGLHAQGGRRVTKDDRAAVGCGAGAAEPDEWSTGAGYDYVGGYVGDGHGKSKSKRGAYTSPGYGAGGATPARARALDGGAGAQTAMSECTASASARGSSASSGAGTVTGTAAGAGAGAGSSGAAVSGARASAAGSGASASASGTAAKPAARATARPTAPTLLPLAPPELLQRGSTRPRQLPPPDRCGPGRHSLEAARTARAARPPLACR
jgi:hypothetical protein